MMLLVEGYSDCQVCNGLSIAFILLLCACTMRTVQARVKAYACACASIASMLLMCHMWQVMTVAMVAFMACASSAGATSVTRGLQVPHFTTTLMNCDACHQVCRSRLAVNHSCERLLVRPGTVSQTNISHQMLWVYSILL